MSRPVAWTVLSVLNWTANHLKQRGFEGARLDAELLLADTMGWRRIDLYLQHDRPMDDQELKDFKARVKQRLSGLSVAHILGRKDFWSLTFRVPPGVFVPRPDTETLVEAALRHARSNRADTILDLCTGSGNVLLALLSELPEARGTGVDSSLLAVQSARENAQALNLHTRSEFLHVSAADFLSASTDRFDVVVCNPPYVPTGVIPGLGPEISLNEPSDALDGGCDGLDFFRDHLDRLAGGLRSGGLLACEYAGAEQTRTLMDLYSISGLRNTEVIRDLAGQDRVIQGLSAADVL